MNRACMRLKMLQPKFSCHLAGNLMPECVSSLSALYFFSANHALHGTIVYNGADRPVVAAHPCVPGLAASSREPWEC
jgi:hypothetical protein